MSTFEIVEGWSGIGGKTVYNICVFLFYMADLEIYLFFGILQKFFLLIGGFISLRI